MSAVTLGRWTLPDGWTIPRAHALAVLARSPNGADIGIRTNYGTAGPDGIYPCIGSAVASWLVRSGLARRKYVGRAPYLTLSDRGRAFVESLGPQ